MPKKRGRGRPKKLARDRRTEEIGARVTKAERAAIVRGAEIAGVGVSEWIRAMALEAAEIMIREAKTMDEQARKQVVTP